jgi:hypothetical protein
VIRWSERKDAWLRANRNVGFERIVSVLLENGPEAILENPSPEGQKVFVVRIQGYAWVVPFIEEPGGSLFLKTAYPSRKMQQRYGGSSGKGRDA